VRRGGRYKQLPNDREETGGSWKVKGEALRLTVRDLALEEAVDIRNERRY
jgi:hypothetical protein